MALRADHPASRVMAAIEGLTPGYFAMVMATGILSIGMDLLGRALLSQVLFAIALGAFASLIVLTAVRLSRFRHAMHDDFLDPSRAFGFLTYVAGTNVIGVRFFMAGQHTVTAVLLAASTLAWLLLGYVIPWTAVLGGHQRPVVASASGAWFNWAVASQSVAVVAATLEPLAGPLRSAHAVLAVLA